MLVALSIGMLTALTATGMSQVEPAFAADKNKCEDNGHDSCNDRNKKIQEENNCKIENENDDNSDHNGGNSNTLTCSNFAVNPEDVSGQLGHDQTFGPIP
jgi:hypothetical protein